MPNIAVMSAIGYDCPVQDLHEIFSTGLMQTMGITGEYDANQRIRCKMTVSEQVKQPFGALHGGATGVLLETAASVNALKDAPNGMIPVGIGLQVNHYRAIRRGIVICDVEEVFRGRRHSAYRGTITNSAGKLLADGHVNLAWKETRPQP